METTITKIKNRYQPHNSKGLSFSKDNPKCVSRTQQHFAGDANINTIMRKYAKSGLLTDPTKVATKYPQFGDFSNVQDYQTMQNMVIQVNQYFQSLPAEIRKQFDNDPQKLQEYMSDEKNHDEALKLGLIDHTLENLKYVDNEGNDVTQHIIDTRGIFRNGKRINKDGSLYKALVEKKDPDPDPEQ